MSTFNVAFTGFNKVLKLVAKTKPYKSTITAAIKHANDLPAVTMRSLLPSLLA